MLAASATVLALQARERTGLGDQIEVPLAASVMEGLCYNSIKIEDYPERYKTQREQEIEHRHSEGLPMNLSYEDLQQLLDPSYRTYKCKDGRGPRTGYLGYDDLVQATTTGIMTRFGGSMETPEEHAHVGTIDVMCGFGGALVIAAALYQKLKTGRTGRPRTSLSALSGLAQIPFCYDYEKRGPFDEPAGREVHGYDELSRFYGTSSGRFVLLSAYEADTERFDTIRAHNSHLADGTPGTSRGSYSFSIYEDHPSGHTVTQLDPYAVRPVRGRVSALAPAEKYGASTRGVMRELGYDDAEIEAMLEAGAISESWSREYLPS